MKLHPQDWVAIVSIVSDIVIGAVFFTMGNIPMSLFAIAGSIVPVVLVDYYEDRFYRRGGKITWLDFMQIRDLMAHGNNFEAIKFTMKRAFNMDEKEILVLKPEEFANLMSKLRVEQRKDET
jgi:hypothetical protein